MPLAHSATSRRLRPRRATVALSAVALAVAATQVGGCSGNPPAGAVRESQDLAIARTEGNINPPAIISGNPRRDALALRESADVLTPADWAQLERLGPRPVWEELNARGRERPPAADDPSPAARPRPRGGERPADVAPPEVPLVAPTTTPTTGPTTAPTTAPATRPWVYVPVARDESELPVEVADLPDGRLRIIWVLRSYGGSNVTTSRDQNTSRRTVALAPPDLTALVSVLTPQLGAGGSVTALPKENTLVITCDRAARYAVVDLLARLDVPQRQVEITAKIFEVSHDFDFQQGTELILNRLASDSSQTLISTFSAKRFLDSVNAAAPGPVQGSVLKLMRSFADAGVSVDVSLQLLAESGLVRMVSQPRMTVSVGQTGYLLAGQELPIQSANIVNNALQTLTSYKPVGVQLYITPQAAGSDRIKLHTISIVSSVSGFAPLPTMQVSNPERMLINPIIDSREAETAVTIHNGDTLVISGLRMIRSTTRENKIPGLGDIPVLGFLFKNHRTQQQLTDLYFFVTPTLTQEPDGTVHASAL